MPLETKPEDLRRIDSEVSHVDLGAPDSLVELARLLATRADLIERLRPRVAEPGVPAALDLSARTGAQLEAKLTALRRDLAAELHRVEHMNQGNRREEALAIDLRG